MEFLMQYMGECKEVVDEVAEETKDYCAAFMRNIPNKLIEIADSNGYEIYFLKQSLIDGLEKLNEPLSYNNLRDALNIFKTVVKEYKDICKAFADELHPLFYTLKGDELKFNIHAHRQILSNAHEVMWHLSYIIMVGYVFTMAPTTKISGKISAKRIITPEEYSAYCSLVEKYLTNYMEITRDEGIEATLERHTEILDAVRKFTGYVTHTKFKDNFLTVVSDVLYNSMWDPHLYIWFDLDLNDDERKTINTHAYYYKQHVNKCVGGIFGARWNP